MIRWVAVIASGALCVAACASGPNSATANEPCSAYLASHDDVHQAVTRHIAAVMWAIHIDAAAPPGEPHSTPVKTLVNRVTEEEISATERFVTEACARARTASALYAAVSAAGNGDITVPDVFPTTP